MAIDAGWISDAYAVAIVGRPDTPSVCLESAARVSARSHYTVEESVVHDSRHREGETSKRQRQITARSAPGPLLALLLLAGCAADEPADRAGGPLPGQETVTVYFNSEGLGEGEAACSMVAPVPRSVPVSPDPVETALIQLFQGPTTQEAAAGYRSPFSAEMGPALLSAQVTDATIYVDLVDFRDVILDADSSCAQASIFAQIEDTLLHIRPDHRIVLAIEGEPRVFYEWMELECDETNDFCDPAPFQR